MTPFAYSDFNIDFDFYQNRYYGEYLTEGAEFTRYITRGLTRLLTGYPFDMADWAAAEAAAGDRLTACSLAACAAAEEFKRRDKEGAASGGVKSQTVSKWRMEYAETPNARTFSGIVTAAAGLYLPIRKVRWVR